MPREERGQEGMLRGFVSSRQRGTGPGTREEQSGGQPATAWAAVRMGTALSLEATWHRAGVSLVEGLEREAGDNSVAKWP